MIKDLTTDELKKAVNKLKIRYEEFCTKFKKSRTLIDAFEDRYINALRSKTNMAVFIMAEIEAIEELFKNETVKQKNANELIETPPVKKTTVADRIYQQNRDRYLRYQPFPLPKDADDELEHLLGAVRSFLKDYWPVLELIVRENHHSAYKITFDHYYNELISKYDFKGDMPIARHFFQVCSRNPKDFKQIDVEHQNILKETAFLINNISATLSEITTNNVFRMPEKKIPLDTFKYSETNKSLIDNFNGLNYTQSFDKISNYINDIIIDFRIRDLKKS